MKETVDLPAWPQPVGVPELSVSQPNLGGLEALAVGRIMESGWIGSGSPVLAETEEKLQSTLNSTFTPILVANGSVALTLALKALEIGPGHEVITSNLTYAATASSIVHSGARPVFADVDSETWQISVDTIAPLVSAKTKAIIVPHVYGVTGDILKLRKFCDEKNIFLIEDCAETFGLRVEGQTVGTFGHIGTFSFFPNKLLTCGEGGAVVAESHILNEKLRLLRGQGMDTRRRFYFLEPGFNFRLTALQAGVLNVQLDRFQELWETRAKVETSWAQRLGPIATRPKPFDAFSRAPWLFTAVLNSTQTIVHSIAKDLAEIGVETRPVFYPLSTMPAFEEWHSHTPNAKRLSQSGISLPTHDGVSAQWIDKISKIVEGRIAES